MVSFPYYSHTTPIRIPKDMGIVWESYHKRVPLLGVPENILDEMPFSSECFTCWNAFVGEVVCGLCEGNFKLVVNVARLSLALGEQWKKGPWLVALFRGWNTTLCYIGIIIDHYKDPYKPTSIMESKKCFFRGSGKSGSKWISFRCDLFWLHHPWFTDINSCVSVFQSQFYVSLDSRFRLT